MEYKEVIFVNMIDCCDNMKVDIVFFNVFTRIRNTIKNAQMNKCINVFLSVVRTTVKNEY